jgi:hypothetical protein
MLRWGESQSQPATVEQGSLSQPRFYRSKLSFTREFFLRYKIIIYREASMEIKCDSPFQLLMYYIYEIVGKKYWYGRQRIGFDLTLSDTPFFPLSYTNPSVKKMARCLKRMPFSLDEAKKIFEKWEGFIGIELLRIHEMLPIQGTAFFRSTEHTYVVNKPVRRTPQFVQYKDGTMEFLRHGIPVDQKFLLHPEKLVLSNILSGNNIRYQNLLLELYGFERICREHGRASSYDNSGTLWRVDLINNAWGEFTHMRFVEVINSTPEKDGSYKHFFKRVPPEMSTPKEAVAWTFGVNGNDYNPGQQS